MPIQHTIRALQSSDVPSLRQMISLAANWRPRKDSDTTIGAASPADALPAISNADFLARYVSGWGRRGDTAFVAEGPTGPIGTSSYRLFTSALPGYGYVDEKTPEISLAVAHSYRRNGIGTALLKALLEQAVADGYAQVSLSVYKENPALHLYRKVGFTTVATQPNSLTMVCSLGEF